MPGARPQLHSNVCNAALLSRTLSFFNLSLSLSLSLVLSLNLFLSLALGFVVLWNMCGLNQILQVRKLCKHTNPTRQARQALQVRAPPPPPPAPPPPR